MAERHFQLSSLETNHPIAISQSNLVSNTQPPWQDVMALSVTATPNFLLCAEPASRQASPQAWWKTGKALKKKTTKKMPKGGGWFPSCHKSLSFNLYQFFLPKWLGSLDITQKIPGLIAQHSETPASLCSSDGTSCLLRAGHPTGWTLLDCLVQLHSTWLCCTPGKKHRWKWDSSFSFLTLAAFLGNSTHC